MLSTSIWIAFASLIFFGLCRYLIYRRPITAEDANKVLVMSIIFALVVFAIRDIFNI